MNLGNKLLRVLQYGAALIMVTPLFYNINFIFPYVFLKNIIFRAVVIILAIGLTVYWHEIKRWRGRGNLIFYALLFFLVVMSLATFLGPDIYNSFWGGWERMDGLLNLLFLGTYLLVLINVFRAKTEWLWLFRASIFTGLAVCFYGLFKNSFNITENTWTTIGNSSFLGYYLLLNLFVSAIAFATDHRRGWRFFYLSAGLLLAVFMLGAASRAPIIAFLLSGMFMWVISLGKISKRGKAISWAVVFLVVILGGWVILNKDSWLVSKINFINRLVQISNNDPTTHNRLLVWQSGWEAFKDRPIFGYGPENASIGINKYYNPLITEQWFDRTHNFLLDYLLTGGILGLAGYLALILSGVYYSWRIRKKDYFLGNILISTFVGYLLTLLFVFDTLNSWIIIMMVLAFVGSAYGNFESGQSDNKISNRGGRIFFLWIIIIALIGTVLFYMAVVKPIRVNLMAGDAYRYSQADPQKSVNYYDQIFAAKTFGMREVCMHLIRYATIALDAPEASVETKQIVFGKARDKSIEYLEGNNNLQVRVGLAQLYLSYGKYDPFYYNEAIRLLENNIDDSPKRMEIYFIIAAAYDERGEADRALEYLERAYQEGRGVKSAYLNLLKIYKKNGQNDNVDKILREYLSEFNNLSAEEYRLAAEYYFGIDKLEEAKRILLVYAIPADRTNWRGHISYASIYEYEGKIDEAIAYLETVLSEHPEFKDIFGEYIDYLESIKK